VPTTIQRLLTALRGGKPRDLNTILQLGVAAKGRPGPEQMDWLRSLVRYVRGESGFRFTPEARMHLLLQRLAQHQDWAVAAGAVITEVLARGSAVRVFCEAGLPSSASFGKELRGRLVRSVLPPVLTEGSLAGVLPQVFAQRGDDLWLARIPPHEREALVDWLRTSIPVERRDALCREVGEAIWRLGNRVTSIALRDEIAARSPQGLALASHPMIVLEDQARAVAVLVAGGGGRPNVIALSAAALSARRFLETVLDQVGERGVSVDLVFQIERASSYISRMESLAIVLDTVFDPESSTVSRSDAVWGLLTELVRGELQDRRPGRVLSQSVHLIARKTVERAGETGEEGIARTDNDLKHILLAAVGGGVFVALTALIKYIGPKGLPPFFDALYAAFNYGASFTVMHFLHLKLATKMPAMTASALSSRLSDRPSPESDAEFTDTATAILRTQVAAVFGNLVGVIPAALVLDTAITLLGHGHLLTAEKAVHVIESISPWGSLTIPFAMFTGVILWLGGWVASWIDNAFAFYNVREALASHGGLRVRFGQARARAFADFLARHVGGVSASLVLGFGLAFAPEIGRFFGLPLEVRHVTLVTGSLSLAVAALGLTAVQASDWLAIAAGITVIGICNLGVSFGLAFAMAVRARGLETRRGLGLLGRTAVAILRHPGRLFHTAANESGAAQAGGH
jgi:site-specific recombinase